MSKTKMFVLTETSPFMMSYVIITEKGNCVIVDGGRPEDVPLLREKVKGRKIKAWFLTHPHLDHITAFNKLVKDGDPDFNFEKVYYNFPDSSFVSKDRSEDVETQKEFNEIFPLIKDKAQVVYTGDIINIDELSIEILYHYDAKYNFVKPTINDTSIAFKVTTPRSSVMFLGDLGAEAGEEVVFDQVLVVGGEQTVVGSPVVDGASVKATVVANGRARKVIVYKYKPKTGYHKKNGHRQHFTQVKIDQIIA
jgi:large subunit ribosomal protein L21